MRNGRERVLAVYSLELFIPVLIFRSAPMNIGISALYENIPESLISVDTTLVIVGTEAYLL